MRDDACTCTPTHTCTPCALDAMAERSLTTSPAVDILARAVQNALACIERGGPEDPDELASELRTALLHATLAGVRA